MDLQTIYMLLGFMLASYSIVGNDAIQTLGTFLHSNAKRPWWVLWLFVGGIMSFVLLYGWYVNGGDVSYGRLSAKNIPQVALEWYHVLPPLVLLFLTRFGIPVSTTFLVLSVFTSTAVLAKIIKKSLMGYGVAFLASVVLWFVISRLLEKRFDKHPPSQKHAGFWVVAQWGSTGFLWSMWLIQDFANIYVFLPRQLDFAWLMGSLALMLGMLAMIIRNRGGKIQQIVSSKTNTHDIRSATFIDLSYGMILFYFKGLNSLPMSTTWVFLGVLAGREFMINQALKRFSMGRTFRVTSMDLVKATAGLIVSLGLALGLIEFFIKKASPAATPKDRPPYVSQAR